MGKKKVEESMLIVENLENAQNIYTFVGVKE